MTTEQKALALVNECGGKHGYISRDWGPSYEALCRAIEAHEADKKAFSDAMRVVQEYLSKTGSACLSIGLGNGREVRFADFILPEPEPDPLVEALADCRGCQLDEQQVKALRNALAARGYKIERIEQ